MKSTYWLVKLQINENEIVSAEIRVWVASPDTENVSKVRFTIILIIHMCILY